MWRKYIYLLILLIILTGCMPDALAPADETPRTMTPDVLPTETLFEIETPGETATVQPSPEPTISLSDFEASLVQALGEKDFSRLQALMGESFLMAYWRSEGTTVTPSAAIEQLRSNNLGPDALLSFDSEYDLSKILDGADPLAFLGPQVEVVKAILVSGWGLSGKDEAILFIAQRPDGTLYWHGVLVALGGFLEKQNPTGEIVETEVRYALAQVDTPLYQGTGANFVQIGMIAAGQTAKVTGLSAVGRWLRVACPEDTREDCWVSSEWDQMQPATPPEGTNPAQPTEVEYVMAQHDLVIYSGPGFDYEPVGQLAGGQIARVTGVSEDNLWWQVMCPDDSIGDCWLSTDPQDTQPTGAPGQ